MMIWTQTQTQVKTAQKKVLTTAALSNLTNKSLKTLTNELRLFIGQIPNPYLNSKKNKQALPNY